MWERIQKGAEGGPNRELTRVGVGLLENLALDLESML